MMKFIFVFATLTLAVASAANNMRYKVDISESAQINGQAVKPGTYMLELKDNHAVLKHGKTVIDAEARIENADKKYIETTVRYTEAEPASKIDEIRLSGTTTKVVFTKGQASGN